MTIRDYKDLLVWQKSMDLAELIYMLTESFPKHEVYGLTQQIRRADVPVPSNIAEGRGRQSSAEFRHFLATARGSLLEMETQLILASRLRYLDQSQTQHACTALREIARMLNGLMAALPAVRPSPKS